MLAAVALSQLLQTCAPNIGERTMTAIVRVESGGNFLAIRDNDVDRTFDPVDAREAVAWSAQLLRLHHSIDLGISQINSSNLGKLGMSLADAFDPCINLHGGATILSYDYGVATQRFGAGQFALRRAIGAYNTGSIFAGETYVNRILVAAGIRTDADVHVPDIESLGGAAALAATSPIRPLPLAATQRKRRVARRAAPVAPANGASLAAPILVPVGGTAAGVAPVAQAGQIMVPVSGPAVVAAPAIAAAPAVAAVPAAAPSPSPAAKPGGLAVLRPFGSPVLLNLVPAVAPVFVRTSSGLPALTTRPTLLVDMTLLATPTPAATTKSQ